MIGGVAHFAVVAVLVVDPVQTVFCLVGRHGHAVVPGVVLNHVQRALLAVAPGHTGAVLRLLAVAVRLDVAFDAVVAAVVRAAVHVLRLFRALVVLHDPAVVAAAALAGRVVAGAVLGPDHLFHAAALAVALLALDAVGAPAPLVRVPRVGVWREVAVLVDLAVEFLAEALLVEHEALHALLALVVGRGAGPRHDFAALQVVAHAAQPGGGDVPALLAGFAAVGAVLQAVVGHDVAVLVLGVLDLVEALLADLALFGVGHQDLRAVVGVGQLLAERAPGLEAGDAGLAVERAVALRHGVALLAVVDGQHALVGDVFHLARVPVALDGVHEALAAVARGALALDAELADLVDLRLAVVDLFGRTGVAGDVHVVLQDDLEPGGAVDDLGLSELDAVGRARPAAAARGLLLAQAPLDDLGLRVDVVVLLFLVDVVVRVEHAVQVSVLDPAGLAVADAGAELVQVVARLVVVALRGLALLLGARGQVVVEAGRVHVQAHQLRAAVQFPRLLLVARVAPVAAPGVLDHPLALARRVQAVAHHLHGVPASLCVLGVRRGVPDRLAVSALERCVHGEAHGERLARGEPRLRVGRFLDVHLGANAVHGVAVHALGSALVRVAVRGAAAVAEFFGGRAQAVGQAVGRVEAGRLHVLEGLVQLAAVANAFGRGARAVEQLGLGELGPLRAGLRAGSLGLLDGLSVTHGVRHGETPAGAAGALRHHGLHAAVLVVAQVLVVRQLRVVSLVLYLVHLHIFLITQVTQELFAVVHFLFSV